MILCREGADEIVAIKRVGWSSGNQNGGRGVVKRTARAVLKFPEDESGGFQDGRKVDVWVASDGYLGMVYKVKGVEIPDVPKVMDEGKKEKDDGRVVVAGVGGPSGH